MIVQPIQQPLQEHQFVAAVFDNHQQQQGGGGGRGYQSRGHRGRGQPGRGYQGRGYQQQGYQQQAYQQQAYQQQGFPQQSSGYQHQQQQQHPSHYGPSQSYDSNTRGRGGGRYVSDELVESEVDCDCLCDDISYIHDMNYTYSDSNDDVLASINHKASSNRSDVTLITNGQVLKAVALVDTGATGRNYVSQRVADWLTSAGAESTDKPGRVCSAMNQCVNISIDLKFKLKIFNFVNNKYELLTTSATVLPFLKIDLIIGLPLILEHELVSKMLARPVVNSMLDSIASISEREQTRADRHRGTIPSGEIGATPRLCSYCVQPSRSDNKKRQRAIQEDETRMRNEPTVSAITAWHAVMTQQVESERERMRKLIEDFENEIATLDGSMSLENEGTTVQACNQLMRSHLLNEVDRDCALCALTVDKSVLLGSPVEPAEEIDEPSSLDLDDVTDHDTSQTNSELPPPENIFGTESLQARIRELCHKYSGIFSSKVRDTPALVEPMTIQVDGTTWNIPASRRAPRPQSIEKMAALKEMVENLLRLNVIRVSNAVHCSQVLLVVKKGSAKLRFCVDYRELNDISESEGWPIPNISELLNRIGSKHAKYFAVMDLTSGYHQAPMSEASKAYTAFVTAIGVFEWNRVPMGLKAACSYFQRTMCSQVLLGLIMNICECYLDDIITYGDSEEQFMSNLEQVFQRLQERKVTLNPAKCRFGMEEIEYVGHVINSKGLTFTRDKLDSVVNFPKPNTHKEMLSFLGLANYFRMHIKNHSDLVQHLSASCRPYKRNQKIEWTPVMEQEFSHIKEMIDACPQLYFFDPTAPVFLQTDASQHGMGAYLFQLVDGKEVPIEFLSKSFTHEQSRWSTPEQEAYAIYYALRKWEHLLKGIKFTLQTDHKNLIYVNLEGSAKVRRWKMFMQEYDFDIEHIAGEDNVVADAFSRLCAITEQTPFDHCVNDEYLYFLGLFAYEDAVLRDYEGPDHYHGVEQLWSLDEELDEVCHAVVTDASLPQSVIDSIRTVHNKEAGHGGVRRTLAKLNKTGVSPEIFSPNMRACVEKFIKECPYCQKTSQRKVAVTALPKTLASTVAMQQLHIDAIGPLPMDSQGYSYILVIIDKFSRWVSLYPLKTVTAQEAAESLLIHMGTFGVPVDIGSDGGSQFMQVIDELIAIVGATHSVTLAHSHEESGIIERANKEIMRHLRAFLFEQTIGADWRVYLPFTQRICNAEIIKHLNVSPAQVIFGAAIDLNRGILSPNVMAKHEHSELSDYVNRLIKVQSATIKYAAQMQNERDVQVVLTKTAALKSAITEFKVGSYVLLEYPSDGFLMTPRPPNKLMTNLKGPLQVISNEGPTYRLRDLVTTKTVFTHVSRIRDFHYDKERVNPLTVAVKDSGQFLVERILNHRGFTGKGNQRRISELEFLVKWVGYAEPDWQPWANLHKNVLTHDYMKTIPCLAKKIPERYTIEEDIEV